MGKTDGQSSVPEALPVQGFTYSTRSSFFLMRKSEQEREARKQIVKWRRQNALGHGAKGLVVRGWFVLTEGGMRFCFISVLSVGKGQDPALSSRAAASCKIQSFLGGQEHAHLLPPYEEVEEGTEPCNNAVKFVTGSLDCGRQGLEESHY